MLLHRKKMECNLLRPFSVSASGVGASRAIFLIPSSPIRRKIREEEAGLKPTCSKKHYDEFRHFRWRRSFVEEMMIARFFNGRSRAHFRHPIVTRFSCLRAGQRSLMVRLGTAAIGQSNHSTDWGFTRWGGAKRPLPGASRVAPLQSFRDPSCGAISPRADHGNRPETGYRTALLFLERSTHVDAKLAGASHRAALGHRRDDRRFSPSPHRGHRRAVYICRATRALAAQSAH